MIRDYEERERKKKVKRIIIFSGGVIVVLLAILVVNFGINKWIGDHVDTTEGVKIIKQLEHTDIKDFETKIQGLEEKEQEQANKPLNERFAGSVILGDSITQGFSEFEVLDSSIIIADIGVRLTGVEEELSKAEELNPTYVFLCYGENDVKATKGDTAVFKQQYKNVIERLKQSLPNANIYINSVLPVKQKQIDIEPSYAEVPKYNKTLQELCIEEKVTFIDNTELVQDEFYESDGIHQMIDYYPIWAKHMAEVAGI
ncbi:MAG: GDSL-type esterase/lipase family protein [Lachnospiraceae bacterium]